ncbi:MAG: beta-phosphoglucomutase [Nitrososphaerales archaeon]
MKVEAFIFDVDGVLTDTVELHCRSWARLAREENLPFSREVNDQMRGLTRPASLKVFLGGRSVTEEQARDYLERKNAYFLEELAELTEANLLPGVLPLLREIKGAGLKIAIGSASKNAREVVRRLGIASYIAAYADGHAVERSKPAPDVFLAAADLLGVAPKACVVVEDAESGIEAAHAAGMLVIGVGPCARIQSADLPVESLAAITLDGVLAGFQRAGIA